MNDAVFAPVDLTMLQDEGVLMAANERFFWPLGLALTWTWQHDGARDLHVRQWEFPDGHRESITVKPDDEVAAERRHRFAIWERARLAQVAEGDKT